MVASQVVNPTMEGGPVTRIRIASSHRSDGMEVWLPRKDCVCDCNREHGVVREPAFRVEQREIFRLDSVVLVNGPDDVACDRADHDLSSAAA